jgi:hypothetical protein
MTSIRRISITAVSNIRIMIAIRYGERRRERVHLMDVWGEDSIAAPKQPSAGGHS